MVPLVIKFASISLKKSIPKVNPFAIALVAGPTKNPFSKSTAAGHPKHLRCVQRNKRAVEKIVNRTEFHQRKRERERVRGERVCSYTCAADIAGSAGAYVFHLINKRRPSD